MAEINQKDRISLLIWFKEFKEYTKLFFATDITAGLSLALFSAPQAIADSLVAGLPPVLSLISVIIGSFCVSLFSSSRYLAIGPNSSISILINAVLTQILLLHYANAPEHSKVAIMVNCAMQLAILIGLLQIVVGFSKSGAFIRFVGRPVILGYLVGVAMTVGVTQSIVFLGIEPLKGVHPLYMKAWHFINYLPKAHLPTVIIGISSILCGICIAKVFKKPKYFALSILIFSGLASFGLEKIPFEWKVYFPFLLQAGEISTIGSLGPLNQLFPHFSLPSVSGDVIISLFPVACTITLFSTLETSMITALMARKTGGEQAINQDLFALGLGNIFCGFFGGMAISASTSRSNLLFSAGPASRFALTFNALFIFLIIFLFSSLLAYIPYTGLSLLILLGAIRMLHFKEIRRCLFVTRSDATVMVITMIGSIFLNLDNAFYLGFAVSIILYLRQAAQPKLVTYVLNRMGEPKLLSAKEQVNRNHSIYLLNIEGELFFAAAEVLQQKLRNIAEDPQMKVTVLNMQNARDLDMTSCQVLEEIIEYLHASNRHMVLCGVRTYSYEVLKNYKLVALVGANYVFRMNKESPHVSLQHALRFARSLVKESSSENIENGSF